MLWRRCDVTDSRDRAAEGRRQAAVSVQSRVATRARPRADVNNEPTAHNAPYRQRLGGLPAGPVWAWMPGPDQRASCRRSGAEGAAGGSASPADRRLIRHERAQVSQIHRARVHPADVSSTAGGGCGTPPKRRGVRQSIVHPCRLHGCG